MVESRKWPFYDQSSHYKFAELINTGPRPLHLKPLSLEDKEGLGF